MHIFHLAARTLHSTGLPLAHLFASSQCLLPVLPSHLPEQKSSLFTLIHSLSCDLFQPHGFNNIYKLSILFPDQVFLKIWTDSIWIWWSWTNRWEGRCDKWKSELHLQHHASVYFSQPWLISLIYLSNPVLSLSPLFTTFWLSLRIQFRTFAKTMPSRAGTLSSTTTNAYLDLSGHFH